MRIRVNRCLVILLILFAPIGILWADSQDSVEADFFEDAPLILTASRMSKPLIESPASVSVIDREMIQASGVREIAVLINLHYEGALYTGNMEFYTECYLIVTNQPVTRSPGIVLPGKEKLCQLIDETTR